MSSQTPVHGILDSGQYQWLALTLWDPPFPTSQYIQAVLPYLHHDALEDNNLRLDRAPQIQNP